MRQFEGAPASNQLIEQSKLLLERTGFFKTVNVDDFWVFSKVYEKLLKNAIDNYKMPLTMGRPHFI